MRLHSLSPPPRPPTTNENTHLVEVRDVGDVDEVDDGEVLDLVRDGVERLVHRHALAVPVVPEADHDDAVLLGLDRLVDVPAGGEVRKEVGHLRVLGRWYRVCVSRAPQVSGDRRLRGRSTGSLEGVAGLREVFTSVCLPRSGQVRAFPAQYSAQLSPHRLGACFLPFWTLSKMSSSSTNSTRPIVFMDVNIGETPAGRLKMELFSDIVPK